MLTSAKVRPVFKDAMYLRGRIMTHYAQIEFLFSHLVMCCSLQASYAPLISNFPYSLERKLSKHKQILASDGIPDSYRERLTLLIDPILSYEEIRHFMAHGLLKVHYGRSGTHALELRMWDNKDKNDLKIDMIEIPIEELRVVADRLGEYFAAVLSLFRLIYFEKQLVSPQSLKHL